MIVESIIFSTVVTFSFFRGLYNGYDDGIQTGGGHFRKVTAEAFKRHMEKLNRSSRV